MTKEGFVEKYGDVKKYDDALELIIDMHYDAMPYNDFANWEQDVADSATYEDAESAYEYLLDRYF